jgi:hypothetical protein
VEVESLITQASEVEEMHIKLSPKAISSTHPESGRPSRPSRIVSTIDSSNADYPSAQDTKTTELLRLKQELHAANSKIALQEQELAHTRVIKHTLDQALGPPSEADFGGREITEQTITHLQSAFNASNHVFGQFQDAWNAQEDSQSDISDALSAGAYNRARGLWNQHDQPSFGMNTVESSFAKPYGDIVQAFNPMSQDPSRLWGGSTAHPAFATQGPLQSHRVLSGPSTSTYGFYPQSPGDQTRYFQDSNAGHRHSAAQATRGGAFLPSPRTLWNGFASGPPSDPAPKSPSLPTSRSSSIFPPIGIYSMPPFHTRPVATALSPTATEFTATSTNGTSWAAPLVSTMIISPLSTHSQF